MHTLAMVVILVALTGCGLNQARQRYSALTGPTLDIDNTSIETYEINQTKALKSLSALAGLCEPSGTGANPCNPPANMGDWRPIVEAGLNYVDHECEKYIDAIFWFNRSRQTLASEVTLIGTATTGAMGILQAAAKEIALTAVAFGLTSASIDALSNSVLYQIEPSGVRSIVKRSQEAYRIGLKNVPYTTRTAAMSAIQSYLALCLPASLETQVNKAIGTAQFSAPTPPEGPTPNFVPSVIQVQPPPPTREHITFSPSQSADTLEGLLGYDPRKEEFDQKKVERMKKECWPEALVQSSTKILQFLVKPEFETHRQAVIKCMRAKNI